jgi:hypothetical protein
MASTYGTRNCVVCNKSFVIKTRNHEHAKYCSRECQRAAHRGTGTKSKEEKTCLNCGKTFLHYASQGAGKFCSRACKDEHWKKPSADRGFDDLTGHVYGRLTVLEYAGIVDGHHHAWKVRCNCPSAREWVVSGQNLKSARTRSCGCIAKGIGIPKPETKKCTRCEKVLPYDEQHFIKSTKFRWGLKPICRECWLPIYREKHRCWRRKVKLEVISHYSGGNPKCSCCGETHVEFLTVDHVNNDGSTDRKVRGAGMKFYALLRREGFPNDPPLTCLCFNCNLAKGMFGRCPHDVSAPS